MNHKALFDTSLPTIQNTPMWQDPHKPSHTVGEFQDEKGSTFYQEAYTNGLQESSKQLGTNPEVGVKYDIVSKPKHYMLLPGVEVRDVCKAMADRMQDKYSAFFISDYIQFLQYVLRFDQKNGVEDLEKAKWYLDKLILKE